MQFLCLVLCICAQCMRGKGHTGGLKRGWPGKRPGKNARRHSCCARIAAVLLSGRPVPRMALMNIENSSPCELIRSLL